MKRHIFNHVIYGLIAILLIICVSSRPAYAAGKNKLNKSKVTVLVSQSVQLSVTEKKSGVRWSSSNKKIAKVSSKGKVTGKKPGKATITAKVGSKSYKCKVTVKIGLTKKNVTFTVGETEKIKLCGTKVKKASSSNKKVATVNKKGVIKAVGAGSATLTFQGKNKKKYKCKVTVKSPSRTQAPSPTPSYQVSFDSDGGTAVKSQTVVSGKNASVPEIPSREGFIFDHWAYNSKAYDFSAPVTANITLTAIWGSGSQTWESAKEVKQVISVDIAPGVMTEKRAVEVMQERGFTDFEVTYDFDMNGEYCDEAEATTASTEKRPRYTTYYVADNGDVWVIYSMNSSVYAYPASFNYESNTGIEVLVSETEEITSYDCDTSQYYVTIPDEANVKVIVVAKIDATTLNALSYGSV